MASSPSSNELRDQSPSSSPAQAVSDTGAPQSRENTPKTCTTAKSTAKCSPMPPPAHTPNGSQKASKKPYRQSEDVDSSHRDATPTSSSARSRKRAASTEISPSAGVKRKKDEEKNEPTYARPTHRMPNFQASSNLANIKGNPRGGLDFMAFNSTIWEVSLNGTDLKYHVHEAILQASPKFAQEILRNQTSKGRNIVKQALKVDGHEPAAFEQMLQFLYKGKFAMLKDSRSIARLREYFNLMALGKTFMLPALQKQIVTVVAKSSLLKNVTVWTFFDWAEDMFYEELDPKNGPFKRYFTSVAPHLLRLNAAGQIRQISRNSRDEEAKDVFEKLLEQIKLGGIYPAELFRAMYTGLTTNEPLPAILKADEGRTASASVAPGADEDYIKEEEVEAGGED